MCLISARLGTLFCRARQLDELLHHQRRRIVQWCAIPLQDFDACQVSSRTFMRCDIPAICSSSISQDVVGTWRLDYYATAHGAARAFQLGALWSPSRRQTSSFVISDFQGWL